MVNPTTASNSAPVSLSFVLRIFLFSEENVKDPRFSNNCTSNVHVPGRTKLRNHRKAKPVNLALASLMSL